MKNNRYKISANGQGVVDTLNNMHVPMVPGNRHWQEFEAWLEHEIDNSPEPSMTIDEFKSSKMPVISENYEKEVLKGYKCESGITYDCTFDDLLSLMGVLGVAELMNKKKIMVRDFNNEVHNLKVSDYREDVVEVSKHHQKVVEKKWKDQENINGSGYSDFKKKELKSFKKKMKTMRVL